MNASQQAPVLLALPDGGHTMQRSTFGPGAITAILCAVLCASLCAAPATAATLDVRGVLRAQGGGPVADGKYVMIFRFYDAEAAKTGVWEQIHDVPVDGGLFGARLGDGKAIPDTLLTSGKALWLGVKVGAEPELSRVRLTRVASAWHAIRADSAGNADTAKSAATADTAKSADTAKTAEHAKTADSATTADTAKAADTAKKADLATKALTADEALSANTAKKATFADAAASLSCTGCIKSEHIAADAKLGSLPEVNVATTACDAKYTARIVVSGKDLYFCAGGIWRKLKMCGGICSDAKNIACGAPIPDDCGDTGKCTGTGTFCGQGECKIGKCVIPPGSTPDGALPTCKDLLAAGVKTSGLYWIDPDGVGKGEAGKQVWCDMTTDGGGWTVLAYAPTHSLGLAFDLAKDTGTAGDKTLGWHWMAGAKAMKTLKFTQFRGFYRYYEDQPGIPQQNKYFEAWVDYLAKGTARSLSELTAADFGNHWSVKTSSGATCSAWYSLFGQFWNTLATNAVGGAGNHGYCGYYNPGHASEGWCAQSYKVSQCNRGGYGKFTWAWYMVR